MSKPHVVLVFGDPDSGKSWLANKLCNEYGYDILALDSAYIQFIIGKYPHLILDSLTLVISQHYQTILKATEKNVDKAWAQYVTDKICNDMLDNDTPVVIEGYLLAPILKTLRSRLSKVARVSVVYVKDRHYYVDSNIERIAKQ